MRFSFMSGEAPILPGMTRSSVPSSGIPEMKKILLSAAVIAASGAYVAYEDHGGLPSLSLDAGVPSAAYAAPAAVEPKAAKPVLDQAPAPAAPQAAPTSAALPAAALPKPAAETASASPPAGDTDAIGSIIAYMAPMPTQAADAPKPVSQPMAAMPLPLPRPADAPQANTVVSSAAPQDVLPARTVAQAQGAYRNGTYKGVSADAYYGRVQVEAIIGGGRLTAIRILDYPSDRARSAYIASRSLPVLEQEAISAQSADVDSVSGATLTSRAFVRSLDSALAAARAGGGNA
jgi:uncharacterized protein with FMN-binding domain